MHFLRSVFHFAGRAALSNYMQITDGVLSKVKVVGHAGRGRQVGSPLILLFMLVGMFRKSYLASAAVTGLCVSCLTNPFTPYLQLRILICVWNGS